MNNVEKFWKKWQDADCLERITLISTLPIESHINAIIEISNNKKNKINKKERSRLIAQIINTYFEDLASCVALWK